MSRFFDIIAIVFPIIFWVAFFVIAINAHTANNKYKQNKKQPVIRQTKLPTPEAGGSHDQQVFYSNVYSRKETTKDSGIHDGPLSEAEKNVLYGK